MLANHLKPISCALLGFVLCTLQINAETNDGFTDALQRQVTEAATAHPPNLFTIITLAQQHHGIADQIAAAYVRQIAASGHEAGLVAAAVVEAIGSNGADACAISAAVWDAAGATSRDRLIVANKVANTIPDAGKGAATDFVDCLAEEMSLSTNDKNQLLNAANILAANQQANSASPASRANTVALDLPDLNPTVRADGGLTNSAASSNDFSGASDFDSDFDSGRKKRNRRTSRSQ